MEPLRPRDPRQVGPYPLESRLGGGGMGEVFLGRSRSGRPVAVKVVHRGLAEDDGFRRRFALEVEAARKVGGSCTAQLVDAGVDADPPWLATAYVPGRPLQEALSRDGPLPAPALKVLAAGLAEGLAAVHACDLVHRNLKPSNIILADDGPRLIDFGIARALDAAANPLFRSLTGTPPFMSPEQVRGEPVGPPGDVFALASALVFAAAGHAPFGRGRTEALHRIVHDEPDLAGVPAPLTGLLSSCLAKRPDDRPTVPAVLDALAAGPDQVDERRAPAVDGPPEDGPPDRANLVIGNLSRKELQVTVDETKLGSVQAGGQGAFPVRPGDRAVQVKALGNVRIPLRESFPRRIEVPPGETVRLAFQDHAGESLPSPATWTAFDRRSAPVAFRTGMRWWWAGLTLGAMTSFIALLGWTNGMLGFGAMLGTVLGSLAAGVLLCVSVSTVVAYLHHPPYLAIKPDGLTVNSLTGAPRTRKIEWRDLEKITLDGDGPDSRVMVWYRGDEHGTVLCTAREVSSEEDSARLHAALKWFAADLYAEHPS